jgi:hypothetical protein
MGYAERAKQRQRNDTTKAPELQIVIQVEPDGRVKVNGPLHKKELCMKMLQLAAEAILALPSSEPEIIVPQGLVDASGLPIARNGG